MTDIDPALREAVEREILVGIARDRASDEIADAAIRAVRKWEEQNGWRSIAEKPTTAQPVLYYHGRWPSECVDGPRDDRYGVGWFDGKSFRECGTGHEKFERWMTPEQPPTDWRPLPAAPRPKET